MLVQEIPKAAASQPKKPARGSVYYGRAALDSAAQQTRITRHLLELEQDNYHAVQIDIPKPERTSPPHYKTRDISSWRLTFGVGSSKEAAQDDIECPQAIGDTENVDELT
jgi:hypothetical protein